MRNRTNKQAYLYFGIMVVGLLALTIALSAQPALADRLSQSAYQRLHAAWQRAGNIAQYDYHSTILQTTTPATTLSNAGRSPQTQRVRVDGSLDKAADAMQMQLQVGQQPPIAVKIADGQAYGRQGNEGEWVELEETPELFGPAATPRLSRGRGGCAELGADGTGMADFSVPAAPLAARDSDNAEVTRYALDLSGPKFAGFMKEQMEDELRRKGELPPSMSLSTASQYVEMIGHGELWLSADGLPVRLLIHVEFPAQAGADGQIAADISTTFSGWAAPPASAWTQLWHDPTRLLTQPATITGISAQVAQQVGMMVGLTLFLLGLMALALAHRQRLAVRAVVYSAIILAMVITPLLQTQQVSALYDGQQARALENAPAPVAAAAATTFSPHENPVQVALGDRADQAATQESTSAVLASTTNSAGTAQAATCTVTESSDCDGDGLSDQIEIHQLGTFVDNADTDGDFINDYAEVQPSPSAGRSGIWTRAAPTAMVTAFRILLSALPAQRLIHLEKLIHRLMSRTLFAPTQTATACPMSMILTTMAMACRTMPTMRPLRNRPSPMGSLG
ncbi:MAG: hypothetical protein R2867_31895 [Caldilineaceae bacterium]